MTLNHPQLWTASGDELMSFKAFLQGMVNRKIVGGLRYGSIKRRQLYMTRLSRELRAYRKTGNMEQLVNIAVYAFLESYAPQNKKFHFNPYVDSVTRKDMGT